MREFYEGSVVSELGDAVRVRLRKVGSGAWSSRDSGLIATDAGGRAAIGAPFGKRSGCAEYAASRAAWRQAAIPSTRWKNTSAGVKSASAEC